MSAPSGTGIAGTPMNLATDVLAPPRFARHAECAAVIAALPQDLFAYLDEHARLTRHMGRSSWRMGGGRMDVSVDAGKGQQVGSRIRLEGRIVGLLLHVETAVVEREPPLAKTWETVGEPRLLVIGRYRMGFRIDRSAAGTCLRVHVDYDLPRSGIPHWLGVLLGPWYARWCTRMMVSDAQGHFSA